jgi:hypothetical protein
MQQHQQKDPTRAGQSPADHETRREILKAAEELFIESRVKPLPLGMGIEAARLAVDIHMLHRVSYVHETISYQADSVDALY